MTTRAISYLKKKNIPYDVVKYEHREKGAEFAASATGYPLERTIKTLVVELDRRKSATTSRAGGMRMAPGRGRGHLCWWPLIQFISRRHRSDLHPSSMPSR